MIKKLKTPLFDALVRALGAADGLPLF